MCSGTSCVTLGFGEGHELSLSVIQQSSIRWIYYHLVGKLMTHLGPSILKQRKKERSFLTIWVELPEARLLSLPGHWCANTVLQGLLAAVLPPRR